MLTKQFRTKLLIISITYSRWHLMLCIQQKWLSELHLFIYLHLTLLYTQAFLVEYTNEMVHSQK